MKLITKSFRFRIYPNQNQVKRLSNEFGSVRFVFNFFLARKVDVYKSTGKGLTYNQTSAELTQLKKDAQYSWLREVNAVALQQSLRDLDRAYQNFFRKEKGAGFPKFKNKHGKQSFRLNNQVVRFDWDKSRITLPKIGAVRMVNHCPVGGRVLSVTVSKAKSGKYFVSIAAEQDIEDLEKREAEVGIDVGLKSFLVTSDGLKVDPPKYLVVSERRLKRLQRELSRRQKGGKNREKARRRVAILHEKIAAQRANFLHQLSTQLTKRHSLIVLEDLNVRGMMANHHLAKAIGDASWSEFGRQLAYKSGWYGCEMTRIGRFEPSSKTCSVCGWVKQDLTLTDREWICPECGSHHDRDINAAINILKFCRGRVVPRTSACRDHPVTESLKQEWICVESIMVQS